MSYELLPNPGVKIAIFRDTRFPFGAFRTLEMRMPINFCAYNSCYLYLFKFNSAMCRVIASLFS